MRMINLALAVAGLTSLAAQAAPLMSAEWAKQACNYWNTNPALTTELAEKWAPNDGGRGYKVIHMYRTDCGEASKVELTISTKGGRTTCVYAGPVQHATLNYDMDYKMHAETKRWKEMGAGEYGPMRAMTFGRLKFEGPMVEAMKVMGPFEQFLLIPGKVPGDDSCPR
jgi:putative sterol carrier protein